MSNNWDDECLWQYPELVQWIQLNLSPLEVPDGVRLDGLGGEAEVGDRVHEDEVLGEEALHQPVQQPPAQPTAGCDGPDLDHAAWTFIFDYWQKKTSLIRVM